MSFLIPLRFIRDDLPSFEKRKVCRHVERSETSTCDTVFAHHFFCLKIISFNLLFFNILQAWNLAADSTQEEPATSRGVSWTPKHKFANQVQAKQHLPYKEYFLLLFFLHLEVRYMVEIYTNKKFLQSKYPKYIAAKVALSVLI